MATSTQNISLEQAHHRPAYQAYQLLHIGFTAVPILAGLDKFFHVLTNWDLYLAPAIANLLPMMPHTFMQLVGVVEIAAGLLVAIHPRTGGYVVALWLWGIILNLAMSTMYYDIALRDLGLSFGAIALALLSAEFERTRDHTIG